MTSHHFSCILLIGSWSLGPTCTQRVDHWNVGSLGAILKSAYYVQNTFVLPQVPYGLTELRYLRVQNLITEIRSGWQRLLRMQFFKHSSKSSVLFHLWTLEAKEGCYLLKCWSLSLSLSLPVSPLSLSLSHSG